MHFHFHGGEKKRYKINIHIYTNSYLFKGWITASPEKNKLKKKNPDQDQNSEHRWEGERGRQMQVVWEQQQLRISWLHRTTDNSLQF